MKRHSTHLIYTSQVIYFMALVLTLFAWITAPAAASDILKERRWAEQLKDSLLIGEAITLKAGEVEFLGLYAPAGGKNNRGGVVLLHGLGAHPDWPDVIAPLRNDLPESGWATLSIQLPVRPNDASFEEYLDLFPGANPRISAAIDYLRQQGIQNIVLVGHSLGAAMAANFLAESATGAGQVTAFVGIGMGQRTGTVADTPRSLAKITIPVLDLYGSQDLETVLGSVAERKKALQQTGNPASRQQEVSGADHFFRGLDASLVKIVTSWLSRNISDQQPRTGGSAKN